MKTIMMVPSYWSRESKVGWKEGDAVYDHPTPLDQDGTLKRLLESIRIVQDKDFEVVVLAGPTSSEIDDDVEKKVSDVVSSVDLDVPCFVVGPTQIERIKDYFQKNGGGRYLDLIQLKGYSNVRNLCLLIPGLMGADCAILIDDDEVFKDPLFVFKAREHLINPIGSDLYGIAGYYVNQDGDFLMSKPFEPWMIHWDKLEKMNEAFSTVIGTQPRVKKTSFVFGGNMVIPSQLFSKIPFDPFVPRGEDIDYLMNAQMFGFSFYLDNQLAITHLPPPKSHPTWKRLREDIFRFVYEREKIRNQTKKEGMIMIKPEDLDPYPGCFLKDDLEEKVSQASHILSEEYIKQGRPQDGQEALQNTAFSRSDAIPDFDPFQRYCNLQKEWEDMFLWIKEQQGSRLLDACLY